MIILRKTKELNSADLLQMMILADEREAYRDAYSEGIEITEGNKKTNGMIEKILTWFGYGVGCLLIVTVIIQIVKAVK